MPPRPSGSVLGHTVRFLRDPFSLIEQATAECGDVFSVRILGLGEWVFLGSPELIREMFKAPTDVLAAGETNRDQLGFMLGTDATFSLDGQDHRRRQRLVHPQLNGPRVLRHLPAMREISLRKLAGWPADRPISFLTEAHRISLEVMIHAMFGSSEGARLERLADLFERFATRGLRSPLIAMPYLQVDLGRFSPWGRILHMRREMLEAFGAEVTARVRARRADGGDAEDAGEEAGDILTALTETPLHDGGYLTEAQLLDEVINLLFAGHETTGNAMTWAMESLHAHPEVLERVRAELDEVVGGEPVAAEHLDRLTYLQAAIQESIRYRPMAPMAGIRRVKKPFEIGGYEIPPGTLVVQCFPAMARRPELYEHPCRFAPEHFHGRKTKPFEWNPFGGGTRMCIGRGLAEVELKVVLATLLQHADFRIAQDEVKPVRQGFFFGPDRGLLLEVTKRS
jgi:unspecific monooxygenase